MRKIDKKMGTMYYGLYIGQHGEGFNPQDVAARLFICPRISPEHALKMLDMLQTGKLSVVKFEDMTDTYIKKLKILQESVPQSLYNPLRALLWDITSASGFPPLMLNDYDFMSNSAGNVSENSLTDMGGGAEADALEDVDLDSIIYSNDLPLGYEWIIKDIRSTEEGMEFLKTLVQMRHVDISCYEELPLYKYYYRFLRPIEYHHPEVECEESYWNILFQLIFAEGEDPKIIEGKMEQLPEIELNFEGEHKYISNLSIEKLQHLTSDLAVQAFAHSMVDIIGADVDIDYAEQIDENNPILKEELLTLYNCNQPYANTDIVAFVDRIYDRIKECDLQTFPYKL